MRRIVAPAALPGCHRAGAGHNGGVNTVRASDAEREQTAERLRTACMEGRLDADELDERLAAAFHARTRGELRALVGDLPAARPALALARRRPGLSTRMVALRLLLAVATLCLAVALVLPDWALMLVAVCVLAGVLVVTLLALAFAPIVALGGAAVWLARRMGQQRPGADGPHWP
jgi:hypothetical protein